MGHFAEESENLKFTTPELTILRTQVLEYFEQLKLSVNPDHVSLQLESSLVFSCVFHGANCLPFVR